MYPLCSTEFVDCCAGTIFFSHHLRWKPKQTEANIKNKLTTFFVQQPNAFARATSDCIALLQHIHDCTIKPVFTRTRTFP
jgi:hypothetical protein